MAKKAATPRKRKASTKSPNKSKDGDNNDNALPETKIMKTDTTSDSKTINPKEATGDEPSTAPSDDATTPSKTNAVAAATAEIAPAIESSEINSLANQIILAFYSNYHQKKRCRPNDRKNRVNNARWLDECDANGTIERCFWPWFLHCAASSPSVSSLSSSSSSMKVELPSVEVAFALAILSNRRGSIGSSSNEGGGGGGGGGDPQLWFVVDDYDYSITDNAATTEEGSSHDDVINVPSPKHVTPMMRTDAFELLLKLLLRYQETPDNGGIMDLRKTHDKNINNVLSLVTQTEVVKFLIASYQSMELRCKKQLSFVDGGVELKLLEHQQQQQEQRMGVVEGPLADLVGVRLWDAIPRRKRHLELKRDGLLRKRYQLFQKRLMNSATNAGEGAVEDNANRVVKHLGFLPGMVQGLFDALSFLGDHGVEDVSALGYEDTMEEDGPDDANNSDVEIDDDHNNGNDDNEDEAEASIDKGKKKRHRVHHSQTLLLRGYISKCLELLLDLLSYPQTRTYVAPYLSSHHLAVKLAISKLYRDRSFVLFRQQVDMLLDSERMEVASSSSLLGPDSGNEGEDSTPVEALPYNDVAARMVNQRAHTLQKLLHRHHAKEASEVVFAGVGRVTDANWLREKIGLWSEETLYDVCYRLRLVDDNDNHNENSGDGLKKTGTSSAEMAKQLGCSQRELLTSYLLYHQSSRQSDAAILSSAPLYPTEALLWDPHSVPPGNYSLVSDGNHSGMTSLSLPKLNARFLSAGDYLLRNFRLFRLESAYEIRGDLVDVVKRMKPTPKRDGYSQDSMNDYYAGNQSHDNNEDVAKTEFQGWARMGLELGSNEVDRQGLRLIRVDPPRLGERVPANVIAELVLDLRHCAASLVTEWSEIGEFDNLFLVSVDASRMTGAPAPLMANKDRRIPDEEDFTFPERYGIRAVRGCMVLEVRDEAGTVLSDPALAYEENGPPQPKGKRRFLRVALDPAQYAADATGHGSDLGTDVYDTFNLVVRRQGRENNFKAVLETIRGLMRGGAMSMYRSIPSWLMPVLLGYGGDTSSASYLSPKMKDFASKTAGVTSPNAALDYGDTFVDDNHLRNSFPGCTVTVDGFDVADDAETKDGLPNRKKYRIKVIEQGQSKTKIIATSYPFPPLYNGNPIRFTPVQANAIRSGLSPGLTTIIGPPGTGKTDVAVQIIANLYHSFPTQRTVIVTHSNAALNDIFDKVMARGDVDERYMLRLGSGEKNLQTTSASSHDFTKNGRVAHILSRRGDLLEKVQQLSESLGLSGASERGANGAPSYTCETSEYFFFHHVKKRMDLFEATVKSQGAGNAISDLFPFNKYFPELETEHLVTLDGARDKFAKIKAIFDELAEYRPIELLRSQRQRTDYLLTKQARIVAMTCTHAAIARAHLVDLGFHYDNIIMEEAGQMLDVETFVPLLLQRGESDDSASSHSRLKRVCLIGDHNQLPPVVKNVSFSKFSRYDQSLFARLIRLGVPSIELNKQGRARPELANLYR